MNQHILAVDDEPHMLVLLERIISEKTSYQIITTSNVFEVFDLLNNNPIDLVITDLKMPGMDGMELLKKIKDQGRKEEVIIMTAYGSFESAIEALSQDVFDYITKPFKKEQILFTIERAMRLQRTKQEAERLANIFDQEPYESARQSFDREYLRKLGDRSGKDEKIMSERSGLSIEQINLILKREISGSKS